MSYTGKNLYVTSIGENFGVTFNEEHIAVISLGENVAVTFLLFFGGGGALVTKEG